MGSMDNIFKLVGRLAISAIFLMSVSGKVMNPSGTIGKIQSAGMPFPGLMYAMAVAVLAVCGVMLVIGWKTRYAAIGLIVFLALATYYFHHNISDRLQMIMALKNLGLAGGLFYVMASGPGRFSLDKG